jgi:ABC-2 type transport system permease protein
MSFVSLLKREWREHVSALYWGVGALLSILVVSLLIVTTFDVEFEANMSQTQQSEILEGFGRDTQSTHSQVDGLAAFTALTLDVAGSTDAELRSKMRLILSSVERIFNWVLAAIVVFGLIACLHDERRDQSILFWKSMPVSDTQTVTSKLVALVWLAPLVTIVGALIAQIVIVGTLALIVEDGMGGRVWEASALHLRPFMSLFGYATNGLWTLPVYAWLMLVSAVATRVPVLWALGIPLVITWFEGLVFSSAHVARAVLSHAQPLGLPYNWYSYDEDTGQTRGDALDLLLTLELWAGIVVGVLLLVITIRARGRYNEA